MARESGAELVGGFGGKTGVMNNDQIVDSVSAGVYKAVTKALSSGQNGDSGDVILNIDGRTLGEAILPHVNSALSRKGQQPILRGV
jgi:hypothetical protein